MLSASLAKAVVAERKKNGPFKSWKDLQERVSDIGSKELDKLQNKATLDLAIPRKGDAFRGEGFWSGATLITGQPPTNADSMAVTDTSNANTSPAPQQSKKRRGSGASRKQPVAKKRAPTAGKRVTRSQTSKLKLEHSQCHGKDGEVRMRLDYPDLEYDSEDDDAPPEYLANKAQWVRDHGSLMGFCFVKHPKSYDQVMREIGKAMLEEKHDPEDPHEADTLDEGMSRMCVSVIVLCSTLC